MSSWASELSVNFPEQFRSGDKIYKETLNNNMNYLRNLFRQKGFILNINEYLINNNIIYSSRINGFFQNISNLTGETGFHVFSPNSLIDTSKIIENFNLAEITIKNNFYYHNCNDVKVYTGSNTNLIYTLDPDGMGSILPYDTLCDLNSNDVWTYVMEPNGDSLAILNNQELGIKGSSFTASYNTTKGYDWSVGAWADSNKTFTINKFINWQEIKYTANLANAQSNTLSRTLISDSNSYQYYSFSDAHSSSSHSHSLTKCGTSFGSVRTSNQRETDIVCQKNNNLDDSIVLHMHRYSSSYSRGNNGILEIAVNHITYKDPVDCQDVIDRKFKNVQGFYEDGDFWIDPDGASRGVDPSLVFCNLN